MCPIVLATSEFIELGKFWVVSRIFHTRHLDVDKENPRMDKLSKREFLKLT